MEKWIDELHFDRKGLIPAIVQDKNTNEILMVAYMNEEAVIKTAETKKATFWSRSRNQLWVKGETSGNFMLVDEIRVDCDEDAILLLVTPAGPACHTGNKSCFYRKVRDGILTMISSAADTDDISDALEKEQEVVISRKLKPEPGSYTNYLFDKGDDKILKKVGEEAAEVVIAGKNRSKDEIAYETADLMYHLTVMLVDNGMTWEDIFREMKKRRD